jgi:hypothetical protein
MQVVGALPPGVRSHAERAAIEVEQRLLLLHLGGLLLAQRMIWRITFTSKPADFASA